MNFAIIFIDHSSNPILFADETAILVRDKDFENEDQGISIVKSSATKWFGRNDLSLNGNKIKTIYFTYKRTCHKQENAMFLGFCMNPTFSWKRHVNIMAAKLSKNIFVNRSLRSRQSV